MEIIGSTRSTIRIEVDGKTTTLTGEGMPPGGDVHFYADLASIRTWDDGTPITDAERERIVRELPETASRTGFIVVVD
jgi:Immunity protein 74